MAILLERGVEGGASLALNNESQRERSQVYLPSGLHRIQISSSEPNFLVLPPTRVTRLPHALTYATLLGPLPYPPPSPSQAVWQQKGRQSALMCVSILAGPFT